MLQQPLQSPRTASCWHRCARGSTLSPGPSTPCTMALSCQALVCLQSLGQGSPCGQYWPRGAEQACSTDVLSLWDKSLHAWVLTHALVLSHPTLESSSAAWTTFL